MTNKIKEKLKDTQEQEQEASIFESRYNSAYKKIRTMQRPEYLTEKQSKEKKRVIARFRCGNEERVNSFWMNEEEKRCRMCGEMRETMEHMLYDCSEIREAGTTREDILEENGSGYHWMTEVLETRKGSNFDHFVSALF